MKTSDKVLEAYSSKHSGEGRKGTLLLYWYRMYGGKKWPVKNAD